MAGHGEVVLFYGHGFRALGRREVCRRHGRVGAGGREFVDAEGFFGAVLRGAVLRGPVVTRRSSRLPRSRTVPCGAGPAR